MEQRDQLPLADPCRMQIDEATESLCLCYGEGILIFSTYKKMIQQGFEACDLPIYLSIVREEPRDIDGWSRKLSAGGGLACFDIINGLYLVDLRAAIGWSSKGCHHSAHAE